MQGLKNGRLLTVLMANRARTAYLRGALPGGIAADRVAAAATNRKHRNESLPSLLARALRETTPLAMALIDLDQFKQGNDTHGHTAGDLVLAAFDLLMPHTPALDAQRKLQALLSDWRDTSLALDSGAELSLQTFSAGVTDSLSAIASPAGLLQAAGARLQQAKPPRGCVLV